MPRTNSGLVAGIIEVDGSIALDPFILAATTLVDDLAAQTPNPNLSADRLQLIETWLAAHFYSVRDPRTKSENAGPVGASYQLTSYYEMAMSLDPTGFLRRESKGVIKAGVTWLGKEL